MIVKSNMKRNNHKERGCQTNPFNKTMLINQNLTRNRKTSQVNRKKSRQGRTMFPVRSLKDMK